MDKDQCHKLISLYGGHKCLWDSNDRNYANRRIREYAWRNISHEMNDIRVTVLKKKMESLMGSYRREKSREKQSRITASGSRDIYKSNWYAYKDFAFMADKNDPGRTGDSLKNDKFNERGSPGRNASLAENEDRNETPKMDNQQTQGNIDYSSQSTDQTQQKRTRKRPKKYTSYLNKISGKTISEVLKILQRNAQSEKDSYSSFGLYVTNELRKYDPMTLTYVKNAICGIIYEANTRTHQQHGYHGNTYGNARISSSSYSSMPASSPIHPPSPLLLRPRPLLPVLSPTSPASPMPPPPLGPSGSEASLQSLLSMSPASKIPSDSQSIPNLSNISPSPPPSQSPTN